MDALWYGLLVLVLVVGFSALASNIGKSASAKQVESVQQSSARSRVLLINAGWLAAWLLVCFVVSKTIISDSNKGGCDGGLCAIGWLLLPPAWLAIGVALWTVKVLFKKADE